ncbi:sulfatase [Candidatus Latescibacterota bacterium]
MKKKTSTTRRGFAQKSAAIVGSGMVAGILNEDVSQAATTPDKNRNVLLLISDDHGRNDLGCYGNPVVKTPNLDRLAGYGVRFANAFATVASCSASRSVIYTGLFNHTNGQFGHQHSFHNQHSHRWVKSVASILNDRGYKTGIVSKLHVQPESVYPFTEHHPVNARNVHVMAEKARDFITSSGDNPFLLVMGYSDPHRDWVKSNSRDYPGVKRVTYSPDDVIVPPFLPDKPEVRDELAQYYESVSRLDQGIGHVLEYLESSGKADDTLIIYISDNGIPFPGAKTTLYDPGIHLPMIVSTPHLRKRGTVNNAMVSYIDIVPTIIDWASAEAPYELPGRSILPILEDENPDGWDEIYASHTFHEITMYYPMRVVRSRRYKYILNLAHGLDYPFASDLYASPTWQGVLQRGDTKMGVRNVEDYIHRPKEELYDLESDPNESNNVAGDSQYAGILDEFRKKLRRFQEDTDDPWVVKYKYE